jgi:hypothetical protein
MGARPEVRAVIELPAGMLDALFAALIVVAQVNRSGRSKVR